MLFRSLYPSRVSFKGIALKPAHIAPAILALVIATTTFADTWNAADNFSANSNPNGAWTYGYYSLYGAPGLDLPSGPLSLTKLTSSLVGSNYISWFTPSEISVLNITGFDGQDYLTIVAGLAPSTAFYAPVVRWTAITNGGYEIRADFEYSGLGAAKTSTSQVGLRIHDTTLTYAYIGGPDGSLNIDQQFTLLSGQYLDFFVARDQHGIAFNANISSVPEPSNFTLLLLGIVAIGKRLLPFRSTGPIVACGQKPVISSCPPIATARLAQT